MTGVTERTSAALQRVLDWPRTRLANLPTPLVPAPRLAAELGHPHVLVKMDAETGFALGGNKVRKLEYELEPLRITGITCLITAGGPQSNHCRITAAFAARHGLRSILVVQEPVPEHPTGNARLHRLFGAEIRTVRRREDRVDGMQRAAAQVEREGGRPLIVPIGASTPLGSLGYVRAAHELLEQLDALGPAPARTWVFLSASSCGTLAGLVLGFGLRGRTDLVAVGVSADAAGPELRSTTIEIARGAANLIGLDPDFALPPFEVVDDEVGEGYGVPTDASRAATDLFARREGIVLDPTYTAKAAAGMVHWIRERAVGPEERVVFLHTGGHPGLLA